MYIVKYLPFKDYLKNWDSFQEDEVADFKDNNLFKIASITWGNTSISFPLTQR